MCSFGDFVPSILRQHKEMAAIVTQGRASKKTPPHGQVRGRCLGSACLDLLSRDLLSRAGADRRHGLALGVAPGEWLGLPGEWLGPPGVALSCPAGARCSEYKTGVIGRRNSSSALSSGAASALCLASPQSASSSGSLTVSLYGCCSGGA